MYKRVRFAEKVTGASALALLLFLFLDWFGTPRLEGAYFDRAVGAPAHAGVFSFASTALSGWHALGWLALALCLLAIAAGLALPFVLAFFESPVVPVFAAIVALLLGGLATIALIVQNIFQPGNGATTVVLSGWWLGLLAAAGIAHGGYLSIRDEHSPAVPPVDVELRPAPAA